VDSIYIPQHVAVPGEQILYCITVLLYHCITRKPITIHYITIYLPQHVAVPGEHRYGLLVQLHGLRVPIRGGLIANTGVEGGV
jgi:hypothetical protein